MNLQRHIKSLELPSRSIYVSADEGEVPVGWEGCLIGKHLEFKVSALETYFFRDREDIVYDAFILMAAVEYCDYLKKRPAKGWGREFFLSVPVHDPEHWQKEAIRSPLILSLNKLTGDHWHIEFRKRTFEPNWPKQGVFPIENNPQAVMAFSNGMDSLSVSCLAEKELGDKLVRIRLGKKEKNRKHPFVAVPYEIHFDNENRESSGRSRGFKFAVLSGAAAYLSKASRVIVPESGQGALGPALIPQGRVSIDYRNHPVFFELMERFLSNLFERQLAFEAPRLWHTKGETLAAYIRESGDNKSWRATVSCWRGARQTSVEGKKRQCGICAACLLRRMSVHAAGEEESDDVYLWKDLTVSRFELGSARDAQKMHDLKAHLKYALGGMAHLRDMAELASVENSRSLELHASHVARAMGTEKEEVMSKQNLLLKNHADEWEAFLSSLGDQSFLVSWAKRRNLDAT
ncbi:7-cyano-7-deazaguanine synthase [Paremcibacter congregatus]|uniref:7-cyano-7-deazaguanine synthase n=1 Tax=Paremcibacter congregatus TaxID=2043170 RepID=UPI003A9584AF